MKLLFALSTIALVAFLFPGRAEDLSPKEVTAARKLNLTKCAKCHRLYDPANYRKADWDLWMEKMRRKSKLKPAEYELLSRYFETADKTKAK